MNLHNEIMNIQVESEKIPQGKFDELPYKLGHRDARHAAAELSLKAEARVEELEKICKVHAEDCNEAESILREIIKEWSSSGDVFAAIMKEKEFLE